MPTHYHRHQSMPTRNRRHVSPSHGLLHDNYASTIAAPMSRGNSGMSLWQELVDIASSFVGAFAGYRRNLQAAKALRNLDDDLLKDIGISRGDIDYVVQNGRRPRRY